MAKTPDPTWWRVRLQCLDCTESLEKNVMGVTSEQARRVADWPEHRKVHARITRQVLRKSTASEITPGSPGAPSFWAMP